MTVSYLFPAVMSIFGGIQGYNAAQELRSIAREEERLGERNALLARRELAEQIRRQTEEDRLIRSAALARAAASGAKVSGSVADYLDYMETEQNRQLEWLRTAGATRIRLELEAVRISAAATRSQASAQGFAALFAGFAGAFSFMDKGGFFTKPTNVTTIAGFNRR